MKITQIDLFIVRQEMARSFAISSSSVNHRMHVLVKLHADGLVGWGEPLSSAPYYNEETTETCWHLLKDFLAPQVIGRQWADIEELTAFYARVKRNNFAKAGPGDGLPGTWWPGHQANRCRPAGRHPHRDPLRSQPGHRGGHPATSSTRSTSSWPKATAASSSRSRPAMTCR